MSRTNNNKQYAVWMGVTALAAASVYYYYYVSQQQQQLSPKKKKLLDDDSTTKKDPHDLSDDITVKSKGRSFDMGDRSATTTTTTTTRSDDPSSSAVEPSSMDETTLHARIEELDKKGKSFFKNKQVRAC